MCSKLTRLSVMAIACIALADGLGSTVAKSAFAGNPEAHFNPYNPRPDFFRKPIYNSIVPYRLAYNRPRYVSGHIAAIIEPTSQEAMAWQVSKARGDYRNHAPRYVPMYYYPKPWEALSIDARSPTPLATEIVPELR